VPRLRGKGAHVTKRRRNGSLLTWTVGGGSLRTKKMGPVRAIYLVGSLSALRRRWRDTAGGAKRLKMGQDAGCVFPVTFGRHPRTARSSDRCFSGESPFTVGFRNTELHNSVPSPGLFAPGVPDNIHQKPAGAGLHAYSVRVRGSQRFSASELDNHSKYTSRTTETTFFILNQGWAASTMYGFSPLASSVSGKGGIEFWAPIGVRAG
jgi:hypothetical protein